MTKLRLLIRFTDLLTFFDLEGTQKCRVTLKTRGRQEHPTMLEGTDEDVINRGLAIVEAGLAHPLKEEMRKELDLLLFPTFEEFVRLHTKDDRYSEGLKALDWLERYRVAKASYDEHGSEPPLGVKVRAFDAGRFGHYRTHFLKRHDEDRLLLEPNLKAHDAEGWLIPKSEWWRFVAILPNVS